MIRSLMNFLAFNAFVLLLPVDCFAAWGWGSPDEKWLMKAAVCALGPLCAALWYIVLSHLVFRRRSSYLVQFLIILGGYGAIACLIRERIIRF
ncbi:MAG: hypothetical protein DMG39_29510 [Acidobacteria bacterium]|nr:MAG: hypothetical protein DMG39_29510 [Acidobacteriota bacterium]